MSTWRTVKVSSYYSREYDRKFAVIVDESKRRNYYPAEAILLQTDETGATRVVFGFRLDAAIVPADELPGWPGRIAADHELTLEASAAMGEFEANRNRSAGR